jgi:hypothetical protein
MPQTVPHLKFNVGDGARASAGAKLYEFAPHTLVIDGGNIIQEYKGPPSDYY